MPTAAEIASNIRKTRLRNPLPQAPTTEQLYHTLFTKLQRMVNRLSNTGKPWATEIGNLIIPAQTTNTNFTEPFTINIPPYAGKIITIVNAYNDETFSPLSNVIVQPELVNIGDMFTGLSVNWFYWGAQRLGIYKDMTGLWKAIGWGYFSESSTYRVVYSVGDWYSNAGVEDSVLLGEHAAVIETDVAIELLDAAQWSTDEEKNNQKRIAMLPGLSRAYEQSNAEFERYIRSLKQPKLVTCSSGVPF